MAATMQTDLKKAMEKALIRQEGITTAKKVVYWLAEENVATRKFSSLMNLLRQTRCPHVDKLSCGEKLMLTTCQTKQQRTSRKHVLKSFQTKYRKRFSKVGF